jgi:hypothetical protein
MQNQTATPTAPEAPDVSKLSYVALVELIRKNWRPVNFAARPYLDAMGSQNEITDAYGQDSGGSIVLYFLNNAGTWKGPIAKAVKADLKRRLKAAGVRF